MNADMEACEYRDQFGNPPIASGRDTNQNRVSGASVLMVDSTRLLPLVMLSCFLSGGAVIAMMCLCLLKPWETEGRAVRAEVRSEFVEKLEKQRADLDVAKYEATLAKTIAQRLDEKDKMRAKP